MRIISIMILVGLFLTSCDESPETNHAKSYVLETRVYTPTKLTVDVELLQNTGQVVFVTVLEQYEITEIAITLYSENANWRVEGQIAQNPKYPHQINQFIYKYKGYTIDIREVITLIRVGTK